MYSEIVADVTVENIWYDYVQLHNASIRVRNQEIVCVTAVDHSRLEVTQEKYRE